MNSIPLIKGNTPQEINTSIIALKKALSELEAQNRLLQGTDKNVQDKIKQINELIEGINTHLGTVDSHLTTIDGQIAALQPVNTVTSGDMHSVTSNAVANYVGTRYITSGSVHPTSEAYFEICRLNLPAGKYLIIGYSQINRSINRVYNFRIIGNDDDITVRGNSNNGGGIINSIICQKNKSFNVIAYGYGFSEYVNNANVQQSASLQALKIGN